MDDLISREWVLKNLMFDVDRDVVRKAPKEDAEPVITGETSDGYHTFNELYHHRDVVRKAPKEDAEPVITGETSDGYHTFNELYHHRDVVRKAPKEDAEPVITGETSDGYHTFNELYHHRAVLFSVIVKAFEAKAWKSKKHHDGTMYDGMFIVGIETPDGQATYHYDIEPYWDMFSCKEVESAPEWDGHTPTQAIERIGKLEPVRHAYWLPYNEYCNHAKEFQCAGLDGCGCYVSYDHYTRFCDYDYCPNCGAKMEGGADDD